MKKYIYAIAAATFCALVFWAHGNAFTPGDQFGGLVLIGGIISLYAGLIGSWADEDDAKKKRALR